MDGWQVANNFIFMSKMKQYDKMEVDKAIEK